MRERWANFRLSRTSRARTCYDISQLPKRTPDRRPRFPRELRVLYEDDAVIAIDKPPGLTAVPIPGSSAPSALTVVSAALEEQRQQCFTVHRIDRFTSGILLFAKTARDRHALVRQFLAHTPVRDYLAVVRGRPADRQGTLVHSLRRQGMVQRVAPADHADSARAELRYSVERDLRGASLVRVTLVTGLRNQIRVQFQAIGHPIIGDRKYHAAEAGERRIDRVALHASRLEFLHPRTGRKVSLECPPPADFRSLVQALAPGPSMK